MANNENIIFLIACNDIPFPLNLIVLYMKPTQRKHLEFENSILNRLSAAASMRSPDRDTVCLGRKRMTIALRYAGRIPRYHLKNHRVPKLIAGSTVK